MTVETHDLFHYSPHQGKFSDARREFAWTINAEVSILIFALETADSVARRMHGVVRFLIFCGAVLFIPIAMFAQGNKANLTSRSSEVDSVNTSSYFLPDAPGSESIAPSQDAPSASGQIPGNADLTPAGQDKSNQASEQGEVSANIGGTVLDTNGTPLPGVTVVLEAENGADRQTTTANENGSFQFGGLRAGTPYQITIEVTDFKAWKSPPIVLTPGQFYFLVDIKLQISESVTSVTVYGSQEQIATEQVRLEEKQRVFGIIPNFYVTYDAHPVPLTTKLKYRLAFKADTDPVTFFGIFFMATIYQAGDIPNYGQGWDAYFQRVGAGLADTTTDIFLGGAVFPSLLHQDPRYFYQGTGTKKSRLLHAMSSPYICKGDNGKTQPNYSSLGGDLASGAISNLYYPDSDRGAGLVFQGFAITTGVRTVNAILQEFVIRKLTPSARKRN
jgi:Carboxypeptidase regulatory-like domain